MPIRIKTFMTLAVSGGLVFALGVALAWLWLGRGPRAAGPARSPALVLVSPLPGGAAIAPPLPAAPPARGSRGPWWQDEPGPSPNLPPATPRAGREPGGRLAIVIDDLGYNPVMPERLLALGMPLTFSIIPEQPYSREVAERVRRAGHAFLVHLPMEPLGYPGENPGAHALLLAMDERATRASLAEQLDSLPGALGANNHMGSAYTADPARMNIVQEMVAARGMLFLNSKTSSTPVPERVARARGFAYLERDVFLDHVRSEPAIRAQLAQAARLARAQGRAIAIGHPYPETLRVLRERLPALAREGVRLVSLSEL
jgi:polysaccharide deacetylase 2 family uncharacterized protein YibQ